MLKAFKREFGTILTVLLVFSLLGLGNSSTKATTENKDSFTSNSVQFQSDFVNRKSKSITLQHFGIRKIFARVSFGQPKSEEQNLNIKELDVTNIYSIMTGYNGGIEWQMKGATLYHDKIEVQGIVNWNFLGLMTIYRQPKAFEISVNELLSGY